jgi:hypothetical protein
VHLPAICWKHGNAVHCRSFGHIVRWRCVIRREHTTTVKRRRHTHRFLCLDGCLQVEPCHEQSLLGIGNELGRLVEVIHHIEYVEPLLENSESVSRDIVASSPESIIPRFGLPSVRRWSETEPPRGAAACCGSWAPTGRPPAAPGRAGIDTRSRSGAPRTLQRDGQRP